MQKPVLAYIAGLTAPRGRTMGHAGAIVTSAGESAEEKVEILRAAGVGIILRPSEFGQEVAAALAKL
jgi:succinyl-CoA synthetase alpha subunit